jgi:CRP-like cAMP-binding protein
MQPSTVKLLALNAQQRADLLGLSSWSTTFSRPELLVLAGFMKALGGGPGALLCKEGDAETFMGILVEGTASVLKTKTDGSKMTIGRLGRDKSFGEMSILDQEPRSATVVADTEIQMLILPRAEFERLMATEPKVANKFLLRIARLLTNRLRETTGHLVEQLS